MLLNHLLRGRLSFPLAIDQPRSLRELSAKLAVAPSQKMGCVLNRNTERAAGKRRLGRIKSGLSQLFIQLWVTKHSGDASRGQKVILVPVVSLALHLVVRLRGALPESLDQTPHLLLLHARSARGTYLHL